MLKNSKITSVIALCGAGLLLLSGCAGSDNSEQTLEEEYENLGEDIPYAERLQSDLVDTVWVSENEDGSYLVFNIDREAKGSDSCNSGGSTFTANMDMELEFTDFVSTMKACPDAEPWLFNTRTAEVNDEVTEMTMLDSSGAEIGILVKNSMTPGEYSDSLKEETISPEDQLKKDIEKKKQQDKAEEANEIDVKDDFETGNE